MSAGGILRFARTGGKYTKRKIRLPDRVRRIGGRARILRGSLQRDCGILAHEAQSHAAGRHARVKSGDVDENPRVACREALLLRSFAP